MYGAKGEWDNHLKIQLSYAQYNPAVVTISALYNIYNIFIILVRFQVLTAASIAGVAQSV
jgi:hypothetical protein